MPHSVDPHIEATVLLPMPLAVPLQSPNRTPFVIFALATQISRGSFSVFESTLSELSTWSQADGNCMPVWNFSKNLCRINESLLSDHLKNRVSQLAQFRSDPSGW
ncbi:uncharacterized protein [Physcomitrium patens]|uniref:uncharacterized protein isoform X2 n=1 Tax=Physcomitrium patens TaxID=3218 RepID=UPI003CCCF182